MQEVVQLNLKVSVVSSLSSVGKDEWDQCAVAEDVNPFLLHDFLDALEDSKSAVRGTAATTSCGDVFVTSLIARDTRVTTQPTNTALGCPSW